MSDTPKEIRRRRRFGLWALLSLALLAAVMAAGVAAVTGRPIVAPGWAVTEVESRVNDRLAGAASLHLGGAELLIDSHFVPGVRLTDLHVLDARGDQVAYLPELRVTFALPALLDGKLVPSELTVSGASLALHRDVNGGLNLALGRELGTTPGEVQSIGGVLQAIDRVLASPVLAGLTRIRADALTLTLDDARAGRVWQVGDGRLTLVQDASEVSIELGFGLANGNGDPATAVMTFVSRKDSPEARIAVRVDNVAAPDIAAQAPALTFLKVVDAPISGNFRASVGSDGQIGALDGRLDFGAGAVQPRASITPIRFDKGTLVFSYDPALRKVTITEASVQSPVLRVRATGQAYLRDMESGLPRTLLAQVKFTQVMVDPARLFEKPVRFSEGAVDLRLRLDPFDLRLGQLMLLQGNRRIEAHGDFTATEKGWQVSLDAALNEISHTDLLALWPVDLVPQTRDWLTQNVQTGLLFNVNAGLRLSPGGEPRLSLGYEFTDADVRFIKTLPPIQQGRGYATIADTTYTMVVDAGHVAAPQGGDIDVAGSVFAVPDITVKPPPAEVKLKTDSTITAALSLLDQPPFGFMTKAGLPVDLADGRARLDVDIHLPLADRILLPDVTFDADGTLTGVSSGKLVKNRVVTADSLNLSVNNDRIEVDGTGQLGRVPVKVIWTQGLGPGAGGQPCRWHGRTVAGVRGRVPPWPATRRRHRHRHWHPVGRPRTRRGGPLHADLRPCQCRSCHPRDRLVQTRCGDREAGGGGSAGRSAHDRPAGGGGQRAFGQRQGAAEPQRQPERGALRPGEGGRLAGRRGRSDRPRCRARHFRDDAQRQHRPAPRDLQAQRGAWSGGTDHAVARPADGVERHRPDRIPRRFHHPWRLQRHLYRAGERRRGGQRHGGAKRWRHRRAGARR